MDTLPFTLSICIKFNWPILYKLHVSHSLHVSIMAFNGKQLQINVKTVNTLVKNYTFWKEDVHDLMIHLLIQ